MAIPWRGRLALDVREAQADWTPFLQPQAPEEAPNVLMIVWDDVGYGAMEIHGGPIETPAMKRIAERGIRYTNFHTTALCSPTRACLVTGRNCGSNGMACITEGANGFPSSSGRIPFENGLISEVLGERGWNTYAIGKWHLTPSGEDDASSWKARWPLGRGFERFYGFLGAETNQWYPLLVEDNHQIDQPYLPEQGYHFSKDLTDKAIQYIRDAKSIQPDKPFFLYFCPGAAHAPHHVWKEWADRYKGKFDMGYEAIRAGILANQKRLGVLPESTQLSPINPHGEPNVQGPDGQPWPALDVVRPWESLSTEEKRLFIRQAEVYAGYVSYTDHEIARLLDYLEESRQLDNTIIVVVSDNGSSAEGGPNGSFNENKFFNGIPDTVEGNLPHLDDWGGPTSYPHYSSGWAWAFDTPFPYWKRYAGYEGGTGDICVVSWPKGIPAKVGGEFRHQYTHAIDIVPTLYDLLDITPPETIKGYAQSRIEGESFKASLTDPNAPEKEMQFYSMLGMRAIYHQGWLANTLHPPLSSWSHFDDDVWELYHLAEDRCQLHNLAAQDPRRVEQLKTLWYFLALQFGGVPLDDRSMLELTTALQPPAKPRTRYVYYPGCAPVPDASAVRVTGRSYTIAAGVTIDSPAAEGVLFADGGAGGGHCLYVQNQRLVYLYSWLGEELQRVVSSVELMPGRHALTAEFIQTGQDPQTKSGMGTLTLYVDTQPVGQAAIKTQPSVFGIDALSIGRDAGAAVSPDYAAPFPFTGGNIEGVVVDVTGEPFIDFEKEVAAWIARE